jgi:hypothetical protein
MSDKPTDLSNFEDAIEKLRDVLSRQTRLIDFVISAILNSPDQSATGTSNKWTRDVLPLMIQAAGSSAHTVYKLTVDIGLQVRDCFPIARSIVESVVNVCFILAEGEVVAKRAHDHAIQKSYRDTDRTLESPHVTLKLRNRNKVGAEKVEGLQESLDKWTTKRGRERTSWTEESIEDRINIIGDKFGGAVARDLLVSHFMIYRHASEIVHGTYFGALFFFGYTQGLNGHTAVASNSINALFSVVLANAALIRVVGGHFGADDDLMSESEKLISELSEVPLFRDHPEQDQD